ncbi:uncharacterized protein LOC128556994 [Mercenaria mercenaria]|uniref:uncharacterized protein LOC128556994 n=1 Tax=Mercenaria mercenaria TaxID=6596 RepID=UPI00234E8404|nr:uncharacterized protein LOC128556994 [Mercenaria mercenaria]
MATELSKQETPQNQNFKIDCKCRRSVLTLLQTVENHVAKLYKSEDESPCTGTDLFATYRKVLLSSILIKGEKLKGNESDLDTTTEFEPFDTAKEDHIQKVLMDRLDRQLVNTTRLRKTASKQVTRKMKTLIRPQLKYLALVSVDTQGASEEAMETDTVEGTCSVRQDEVQERLQGSVEKCSYNKQYCEDMLQKSRDLSQAMQIFKQSESSEIIKAMYETPPNTPTVSSDGHTFNKDMVFTRKISKKLLP